MVVARATNGTGVGDVKRVVVVGGGIIGSAIAFYLTELSKAAGGSKAAVTLVEREAVACAASGKAGGFLALEMNDGSDVGPLSRKSYALHAELAERFGADAIGYRRTRALAVAGKEAQGVAPGSKSKHVPAWLDGPGLSPNAKVRELCSEDTSAQVHPAKLTTALAAAAQEQGASVITAVANGLALGDGNEVMGVKIEGQDPIPADVVVLALGPWSDIASSWLPRGVSLPRISAQKAHSIVLRPQDGSSVPNDMLFTDYRTAAGRQTDPEVYPRPDGTVYICGETVMEQIPTCASQTVVEPHVEKMLRGVGSSFASCLAEGAAELEIVQACHLPCSTDGIPVIGAVPGLEHVYVAAGHSCWGILNGPATGLAMAELVLNGTATSVDLAAFSPARFVKARRR